MPQTLLLRLPLIRTDDAEWVTLDDAGQPAAGRQRGPLELAAAVGRSARVVIVVPATHVLLAEPELPPGNGLKLARAAPFALEEQLTEDIDQLVFALGKRRPNGGTPVAVVSRSVLEGWMSDLKTAGIAPVAMYADMSLVPHNPGQTLLWFERGRLSVRRPGMLPFAVELTPVTEALIVAGIIADPLRTHGLVSTLEAAPTPESALFYVTREDWGKVQTEIESLIDEFASLKVQILPDGPLPWLARELRTTDAVNLLQGEFAQRRDSGALASLAHRGRIGDRPVGAARRCAGLSIAPREAGERGARHRDKPGVRRGHADRDAAESAPSDAGAPRPHKALGRRPATLPAYAADTERSHRRGAKDQHRFDELP